MEEHVLIRDLKLEKESAYRLLVDTYKGRVFNSILNILQDEEDADDTTQDTFIQVFQSINQFNEQSALGTWIHRIAIRKALDKLRQRKNRQRLLTILPWWMPKEEINMQHTYHHPGIALENKERAADLFKAINTLPEKQKVAFNLIKVEGMSYDEASAIMEQSIKGIESLISRAKVNLQKQLAHHRKQ
ncbi:MAG: RNA polymerase sigma factor [Bacteroidota bacterium]